MIDIYHTPQTPVAAEVQPPKPVFGIYDLADTDRYSPEFFYTDSYTIDNDNKVHFMQIGRSSLGQYTREMVVLRYYRIVVVGEDRFNVR